MTNFFLKWIDLCGGDPVFALLVGASFLIIMIFVVDEILKTIRK
jgi:hypothetical protein